MSSSTNNHPFKIGQLIEGVYLQDIEEHFIVSDIFEYGLKEYNDLPRLELYRIKTQEFLYPTIERMIFSWMKDYGFRIVHEP